MTMRDKRVLLAGVCGLSLSAGACASFDNETSDDENNMSSSGGGSGDGDGDNGNQNNSGGTSDEGGDGGNGNGINTLDPGAGGTGTNGEGTGGATTSNPSDPFAVCPNQTYTPQLTQTGACAMSVFHGGPIADFETAEQADWFGAYANDPNLPPAGTTTTPPTFLETPVNRVPGGANGTAYSIQYTGSGFSAANENGIRLNTAFKYAGGGECQNVAGQIGVAAGLTGLSFWAKGTIAQEVGGWMKPANTLVVLLGTQKTVPVAEGGDCVVGTDPLCYIHPDYQMTLTGDWREYRIPFDCFGDGSVFDGHVLSLLFHARGASFDFSIDEISFY